MSKEFNTMKKLLLFCLLSAACTKNLCANEYTDLISYRNSLKQQIQAVDSELARCEKSLKNWQTATIIGGVGAIASGIGIIVQNNQVQENKKTLNKISAQAKEADVVTNFIQKVNE